VLFTTGTAYRILPLFWLEAIIRFVIFSLPYVCAASMSQS